MPSGPQGTKCSRARTRSTPFSSGWWAVTTTQSPSPGAPKRPSAMEKPRSVALPRQAAASSRSFFFSSLGRSRTRLTWQE